MFVNLLYLENDLLKFLKILIYMCLASTAMYSGSHLYGSPPWVEFICSASMRPPHPFALYSGPSALTDGSYLVVCVCVCVCVCAVAQLSPTLCNPMDHSLPGTPFMQFSKQES